LYFCSNRRAAIVSVVHPTWRSYEWSCWTVEVYIYLTWVVFTLGAWQLLGYYTFWIRLAGSLAACALYFRLSRLVFRRTLRDVFARRLFGARTTLRFHWKAIEIRSSLYAEPLVIRRDWRGVPVQLRFIVREDYEAKEYVGRLSPGRELPRHHLNEAALLEVVVSLSNQGPGGVIQRSIPITEISARHAPHFTMVYTAASSLTNAPPAANDSSPSGVDIDSAD